MPTNPNDALKHETTIKILRPAKSTQIMATKLAISWTIATMMDDLFSDIDEPASAKILLV